jgi:hypothetical protein
MFLIVADSVIARYCRDNVDRSAPRIFAIFAQQMLTSGPKSYLCKGIFN